MERGSASCGFALGGDACTTAGGLSDAGAWSGSLVVRRESTALSDDAALVLGGTRGALDLTGSDDFALGDRDFRFWVCLESWSAGLWYLVTTSFSGRSISARALGPLEAARSEALGLDCDRVCAYPMAPKVKLVLPPPGGGVRTLSAEGLALYGSSSLFGGTKPGGGAMLPPVVVDAALPPGWLETSAGGRYNGVLPGPLLFHVPPGAE